MRRIIPTRNLVVWASVLAFAAAAALTFKLTSPEPVAFASVPGAAAPPVEQRAEIERQIIDGWRCVNDARRRLGMRPLARPKRVWLYGAIVWQERCRTLTQLVNDGERDMTTAIRLVFTGPGALSADRVFGEQKAQS